MKKTLILLCMIFSISTLTNVSVYAQVINYFPADNHKKIERYFDSHYVGKSTITIFIDQPIAGSRLAVDLKDIYHVGHSFVRIQYYEFDDINKTNTKKVVYRSFYPTSQLTMKEIIDKVEVDGFVSTESSAPYVEWDHIWSIGKPYIVSNDNAKKALEYINTFAQSNPKFNVQTKNCSSFVINVLEVAGVKPEIKKHKMSFTDAQKFFAYQAGFTGIANGYNRDLECYSAGDAGEDLRLTDFYLTNDSRSVIENGRIKIGSKVTGNYKYLLKSCSTLKVQTKSKLVSYMIKNKLKIKSGNYLVNTKMSFADVYKVFQFEPIN